MTSDTVVGRVQAQNQHDFASLVFIFSLDIDSIVHLLQREWMLGTRRLANCLGIGASLLRRWQLVLLRPCCTESKLRTCSRAVCLDFVLRCCDLSHEIRRDRYCDRDTTRKGSRSFPGSPPSANMLSVRGFSSYGNMCSAVQYCVASPRSQIPAQNSRRQVLSPKQSYSRHW